MKIAIFSDSYEHYICGISLVVKLLYDELTKLGHEVYIVTFKTPLDKEDIKDHIIYVEGYPMKPEFGAYNLKSSKKEAERLLPFNFDVIHLNNDFTLTRIARRLKRKQSIPFVHTYHTNWAFYYRKKFPVIGCLIGLFNNLCFTMRTARFADERIVPSYKTKMYLRKYGIKKNVNIIPSAIDYERFTSYDSDYCKDIITKYNLEGKKVILYLGRVSVEKGLKGLMKNTLVYLKDHPNTVFMIAGGGPYIPELTKMAKDANLESQVIFVGEVKTTETQNYYRVADVFVTNSHMETQGLTYAEAMTVGTPILAVSDLVLKGVIEDHKNGFIFKNQTEYLTKLEYILNNDMTDVIEEGKKTSLEYTQKTYINRIIDVYQKALNAKKQK